METKKTLKQRILGNWFSRATLVIAAIALVLSYQANENSRQANQIAIANSSPKMSVVKKGFSRETITVTGCRDNSKSYYVQMYVANEFAIANNGGRTTSLIGTQLKQGDREYIVRIYPAQSYGTGGIIMVVPVSAKQLMLPLKIETGDAGRWLYQGEVTRSFNKKEDALASLGTIRNVPDVLSWSFAFSDGTTTTLTEEDILYSVNPNLDDRYDQLPCSWN
jgi:hypothetical protein